MEGWGKQGNIATSDCKHGGDGRDVCRDGKRGGVVRLEKREARRLGREAASQRANPPRPALTADHLSST